MRCGVLSTGEPHRTCDPALTKEGVTGSPRGAYFPDLRSPRPPDTPAARYEGEAEGRRE